MEAFSRRNTFLFGLFANNLYIAVTIVVGIISVPIGVHYFGNTRFGIWSVVISFIMYFEISTLGIKTAAAALLSRTSKQREKWFIIKKSLLILIICAAITLIFFLIITTVIQDWFRILGNIPPNTAAEAATFTRTTCILFLLNQPLTIFYSAFVGSQQIHWERFYLALTVVCTLVALGLTIVIKGSLVTLAVIRGVSIILVGLVCACQFILVSKKTTTDDDKGENKELSTKYIVKCGLRFLSIGVASMCVLNSDNLIISHCVSVEAVTTYFIAFKLYGLAFALFSTVNSALWPMYGKAASTNDWEWIVRTYNNSIVMIPLFGGLIWLFGILLSDKIIELWVGPDAYAGIWVVFCFGAYGYILSMVNTHSQLLTGMNYVKNMTFIAWIEAITTVGASLLMASLLGILGVALARVVAPLLTVFWMLPLAVYLNTDRRVKWNFRVPLKHFITILGPALVVAVSIKLFNGNSLISFCSSLGVILLYLLGSWNMERHTGKYLFDLAGGIIAERRTPMKNRCDRVRADENR